MDDGIINTRVSHGVVPGQPGQGEWCPVDLGHEQALEHGRIELGSRATGQETVQLHQQLDVHVLRLGCRTDLAGPKGEIRNKRATMVMNGYHGL